MLLVVARQQDVAAARLAHEDAEALRSTATSNRVGGAALIAFGALALAAALTLSVLPPASAAAQAPGPVPAIAPTPGGAVVVLAWSTP